MAVTLESNRIPLEPAIPALVSPVDCAGRSSPLGATILRGGVNFSIFYRGASGIELLFFDREDDTARACSSVSIARPILPRLVARTLGRTDRHSARNY